MVRTAVSSQVMLTQVAKSELTSELAKKSWPMRWRKQMSDYTLLITVITGCCVTLCAFIPEYLQLLRSAYANSSWYPGAPVKFSKPTILSLTWTSKSLKKKTTPNFTVVEQTTFVIFQSTIDIRARISCLQEKTDSVVNCKQTHQWIWSTCIDQESCLCPEVSKYQTKLFRAKRYNYEFDDIKI